MTAAPISVDLTPAISSTFDADTRIATVREGVISEFDCVASVTTSGPADVVVTLYQDNGTPDVTTYQRTSNTDSSCSATTDTQSVFITPYHNQHNGQRLECYATNDAGSTEVSYVILNVEGVLFL